MNKDVVFLIQYKHNFIVFKAIHYFQRVVTINDIVDVYALLNEDTHRYYPQP